jgi:hypothetical protein
MTGAGRPGEPKKRAKRSALRASLNQLTSQTTHRLELRPKVVAPLSDQMGFIDDEVFQ